MGSYGAGGGDDGYGDDPNGDSDDMMRGGGGGGPGGGGGGGGRPVEPLELSVLRWNRALLDRVVVEAYELDQRMRALNCVVCQPNVEDGMWSRVRGPPRAMDTVVLPLPYTRRI